MQLESQSMKAFVPTATVGLCGRTAEKPRSSDSLQCRA